MASRLHVSTCSACELVSCTWRSSPSSERRHAFHPDCRLAPISQVLNESGRPVNGRSPSPPLRVVPLFETLSDLEASRSVMESLFRWEPGPVHEWMGWVGLAALLQRWAVLQALWSVMCLCFPTFGTHEHVMLPSPFDHPIPSPRSPLPQTSPSSPFFSHTHRPAATRGTGSTWPRCTTTARRSCWDTPTQVQNWVEGWMHISSR